MTVVAVGAVVVVAAAVAVDLRRERGAYELRH